MAKGYEYRNAENRYDKELARKREQEYRLNKLNEFREMIIGLMEDTTANGFTGQDDFLIKYFRDDEENFKSRQKYRKNSGFENYERFYLDDEWLDLDKKERNKLEIVRYESMIDLLSEISPFNKEKQNQARDIFHKNVKNWDEYLKGMDEDPIIIKKLRNLQLLNKLAHTFEYVFEDIILLKLPSKIEREYSEDEKAKLYTKAREMFSPTEGIAYNGERYLMQKYNIRKEQIDSIKKEKALAYCIYASKWMFKQKSIYFNEIINEIKEEKIDINYGRDQVEEDNSDLAVYIFDVPEYGQFSIHVTERSVALDETPKYEGMYLGRSDLLIKADPELIKKANYKTLSPKEKQEYKTATKKISDPIVNIEIMLKNAKDRQNAIRVIEEIEKAGLDSEKVITQTVLDKATPESVRDIIEVVKGSNLSMGVKILEKCSTLLISNIERAIDILDMIEIAGKLGIDPKIFEEYPTVLAIAKSERFEGIYDVLKQYKIMLTNRNISNAFMGNAKNIQENLDLAIESGLYEIAKIGSDRLFKAKNKSLNLKINLLTKNNEPLIVEVRNKKKINDKVFVTEKELLKKYGVTKKEVIEELERKRGQELIQESLYYIVNRENLTVNETENEKEIGENRQIQEIKEKQDNQSMQEAKENKDNQELVNELLSKIDQDVTEEGVVIQLGEYFYSYSKVKKHLSEIVEAIDTKDLPERQKNEILKIALLKDKNISKAEVDFITEEIAQLEKRKLEKKNQERYENIKETTEEIIAEQENIKDVKSIIKYLKERKKEIKQSIKEIEAELNDLIQKNNDTNMEVLEKIEKLQKTLQEQIKLKEEIQELKGNYKNNKAEMKKTLQENKAKRSEQIDGIEH